MVQSVEKLERTGSDTPGVRGIPYVRRSEGTITEVRQQTRKVYTHIMIYVTKVI